MAETVLFVYGTLKKGLSNHFRMENARFVGPARTLPIYRMYSLGWHPGLVYVGAEGAAIEGEMWAVPAATLIALDDFEGVPHAFVRQTIALAGIHTDVEAYFYNGDVPTDALSGTVWPLPT